VSHVWRHVEDASTNEAAIELERACSLTSGADQDMLRRRAIENFFRDMLRLGIPRVFLSKLES
jgi:hypothetical protein